MNHFQTSVDPLWGRLMTMVDSHKDLPVGEDVSEGTLEEKINLKCFSGLCFPAGSLLSVGFSMA